MGRGWAAPSCDGKKLIGEGADLRLDDAGHGVRRVAHGVEDVEAPRRGVGRRADGRRADLRAALAVLLPGLQLPQDEVECFRAPQPTPF